LWKISSVIKAFYTNMAAGSSADPFASFVSLWSLSRCHDNKLKKMQRALNFPLSPHSVGLITTSYSLLQPLRKHRTLLICWNKMHLPRIWLFWTVTLWRTLPHPVFGICSSDCLCNQLCCFHRTVQAELPASRFSCKGPFWTCLHQWDCNEEREQLRHFRRKFTSEKRLFKELSYFHVLYFWSQSFYFFFPV